MADYFSDGYLGTTYYDLARKYTVNYRCKRPGPGGSEKENTLKKAMKGGAAAFGAVAGLWGIYSMREALKTGIPEKRAFEYLGSLLDEHDLGYVMERFETATVESDGVELKLYVFESSPGDPAVVFIPGTGVYALLYGRFMSELSDRGFNVIGYDCRGHGLSGGPRGSYSIGQMVEDTRNVVSYAIGRYGEKVAVAGSSQGGIVAFYTAAADGRLGCAVCHNLLAPDEPDNYRMTRFPAVFKRLIRLMPLVRFFPGWLRVPVSLYLDLNSEPCRLMPDMRRFMKSDPLVVLSISLEALASLTDTPLATPVEEMEVPVMVIHSELDNIFPADYVKRVFDRLRCRKKMVSLDGTPHLVLIDFVDDVLPEVVSWLEENLG